MSLSEQDSQSPPLFPSVNSYDSWIPRDFPDDLFNESSSQQALLLTPEEERLFRSFGDVLDTDLDLDKSFTSTDDSLDDKEAVYAEAQAAGLFKGGLRRAAFSMSDLQAFQPQVQPMLRSRPSDQRNVMGALGSSNAPRLPTVPESKAMPNINDFGDELMIPTSMPERMSADVLDGLDFSAMPPGPTQSGSSFGGSSAMRMFSDAEAARFNADMDSLDLAMEQPGIKIEPDLGTNFATEPLDFGTDLSRLEGQSTHAFAGFDSGTNLPHTAPLDKVFDYSYMDVGGEGSSEGRPPLPPRSSSGPGTSAPAWSQMLDSGLMASSQQAFKKDAANIDPPKPAKTSSMTTRSAVAANEPKPSEQQTADGGGPRAAKKSLFRSQSALELRSMSKPLPRQTSYEDLQKPRFIVELTTPEGHTYTAGRLSNEDRAQKILRYRQKRHERNFNKRIKYMCRKTLADSRPRVRGRFARNDDAAAVMPHETKKALAEKAKRERKAAEAAAAEILRAHDAKQAALKQAQLAARSGGPAAVDFNASQRQKLTSDRSDLIPTSIPHVDSDPSLSTTTEFTFAPNRPPGA